MSSSHIMKESPDDLSWRARFASIAVRNNIAALYNQTQLGSNFDRHILPAVPPSLYGDSDASAPLKVGIVGAGIAGLFTALLFDHLKEEYNLEVEYEILEAAPQDRLGGRLYSYYFKNVENPGPHDYYDVGAMRFPEIDIMKRTFDLFKECKMKKHSEEECKKQNPPLGDLRPYYLNGPNTTLLYNDIQVEASTVAEGNYEVFNTPGIPDHLLKKGPDKVIEEAIHKFTVLFTGDPKEGIPPNPQAGWDKLMDEGDKYSVRQYLSAKKHFSYDTIEWLETFTSGNRWYDQSFSEMVLESLDFDNSAPWWCVEGGANQLAQRTYGLLKHKENIAFNSRVTKMELYYEVFAKTQDQGIIVTLTNSKGNSETRNYSAVFNSVPLGCMQRMDLTGLNLNYGTKQAIRSLGYGASCKVGIRFKTLWWMNKDLDINQGGVSKTDRPLRVCVYPSYNIHDKKDGPGVLLVSYSWSQEAQRLGALINRKSPKDEEELVETMFHDLAKMHMKPSKYPDAAYKEMYGIIKDAYETHFAHDWYADPYTTGAFAYFGPGQFQQMYPFIEKNDGRHIIIGEAASAHHAWVVGALESAVRGVYQFLVQHASKNRPAVQKIVDDYDHNKIRGPFGPLPMEFNRSESIKLIEPSTGKAWTPEAADKSTEKWTNNLAFGGEWLRTQLLFEGIRQELGTDQFWAKDLSKKEEEIVASTVVSAAAA